MANKATGYTTMATLAKRAAAADVENSLRQWASKPATGDPCSICGDEEDTNHMSEFWDGLEGWRYGALCRDCALYFSHIMPTFTDPAYHLRDERALAPSRKVAQIMAEI